MYVILRRYPDASDGYIAVTYIPNDAPVRQKTLFASTRLTLVRELGIERFRETIFATEAKELTAEGFKKHDAHTKLAAPLTEEEKLLGAVRKAEMEEGRGLSARSSHVGSGMTMPVDDAAMVALQALAGDSSHNLVQLRLTLPSERIALDSSSTVTPATLSSTISSTEPRYSFYKHTDASTSTSPIVFIYTCPSTSKVKERMVYSTSRNYVATEVAKQAGLSIEKKMEASDPDDISESAIEEEFKPKVEVKRAFDRPKRPGRR